MNIKWNKEKSIDIALLLLRIGLAVLFIYHGYHKLFGDSADMTKFAGFVGSLGFPLPVFFAYAAAISQFAGGLFLLFGALSRFWASMLVITMAVATIGVHKAAFPESDLSFSLLVMALVVAVAGPGRYSIDALFCRKHAKAHELGKCKCRLNCA